MGSASSLTPEWQQWVKENVGRGCDKHQLLEILLGNGFEFSQACRELDYNPKRPVAPVVPKEAKHKTQPLDRRILVAANAKRYSNQKLELHLLKRLMTAEEIEAFSQAPQQFRLDSDLWQPQGEPLRQLNYRMDRLLGVDGAYCQQAEVATSDAAEVGLGQFDKQQLGYASYGFFVCVASQPDARLICKSLKLELALEPGDAFIWKLKPGAYGNRHGSIPEELPLVVGARQYIYKRYETRSRVASSPAFYTKEPNDYVKSFTDVGFVKTRIDSDIFEEVLAFYQGGMKSLREETVPGGYVHTRGKASGGSDLIDLTDALRKRVHDNVKPQMEAWSGVELEPSVVYGIRVYRDGAILKPHRDRIETHVFGAIINIAKDVDEDWALEIDDHYYRTHTVYLEPGEMLFYESTRLTHGRPDPFKGRAFANVFCHFRPVGYIAKV